MLTWFLIIFGIGLRLVPHADNFTPVTAIALFAGVYLSKKNALILPLILMIISDIFIGLHNTIFFTWGSFAIIAYLGVWIKDHKNTKTIFAGSLWGAIIFFILTNLGVWVMGGLYPQTFEGLLQCYQMAIPFFKNTLTSSLLYSAVLFGTYEIIAARVKNTRLASALLTP